MATSLFCTSETADFFFLPLLCFAEPAKLLVPLENFDLWIAVSRGTKITIQFPGTGVLREQQHEFFKNLVLFTSCDRSAIHQVALSAFQRPRKVT